MLLEGRVVGLVGVMADADFLAAVEKLRARVFAIGAGGILAAFLLAAPLARTLTGPLGKIIPWARSLGAGDLTQPAPVAGRDEIGFLAGTLEQMRLGLVARDREQRAMVAGVAHEIRNPLGGIRLYAEILSADTSTGTAARERLGKMIREMDRLGAIVDEFLLFARPAVAAPELVDLAEVGAEILDAVALAGPAPGYPLCVGGGPSGRLHRLDRSEPTAAGLAKPRSERGGGGTGRKRGAHRGGAGRPGHASRERRGPGAGNRARGERAHIRAVLHDEGGRCRAGPCHRAPPLPSQRRYRGVRHHGGRRRAVHRHAPRRGSGGEGGEVRRILVVEDQQTLREAVVEVLGTLGCGIEGVASAADAKAAFEREPAGLVLTDMRLESPEGGLDVLRFVRGRSPRSEVLLMTAFATVEAAVEAMRAGAFDFLVKPFSMAQLTEKVRRVLAVLEERDLLEREREQTDLLRAEVDEIFDEGRIVGRSAPMLELLRQVEKVAPSPSSVLILGESGTGKEVVARAIHRRSRRREGPFVKVNCGALAEGLLESELFGHEKGAFTGAVRRRRGRFELADGGIHTSRRDRRDLAGAPGEVVAGSSGALLRASGGRDYAHGRRAGPRRHQPRPPG